MRFIFLFRLEASLFFSEISHLHKQRLHHPSGVASPCTVYIPLAFSLSRESRLKHVSTKIADRFRVHLKKPRDAISDSGVYEIPYYYLHDGTFLVLPQHTSLESNPVVQLVTITLVKALFGISR
jgi:hypothetical protein